jgi:hypothetical protein
MQIVMDLDGTLCTEEPTFRRSLAVPLPGAVAACAKLVEAGHTIIIYSSRQWLEYEMTVAWLQQHGFKYHQLVLGKPVGHVWVDDRARRFISWDDMLPQLEQLKG